MLAKRKGPDKRFLNRTLASRVSLEEMILVRRAAHVEGLTVSAFVRRTVINEADRIIWSDKRP